MTWFVLGVGLGLLLAVPLMVLAARRAEQRVRKLERRARAAERLAELGTLTGGLAHEIKNPLSTIGLNIQLLQEDLHNLAQQVDPTTPVHDGLGRVERRLGSLSRETHRLRDILEDFLRYAGRMKLDRVPIDLNQVVDELADFFAAQASQAQVRLRTQLADQPAVAHADASLVKQALLNLMINAVQAMSEAREHSKPHGGANELIVRVQPRKGEIAIHVTDTGPGINPEHVGKIFQPYYSTKKRGTGLGLPTTRRIMEEHGGAVTCHSELGRGTEFVMTLPTGQPEPTSTGE
jgi:signal transduction histidine kinase